MRNTSLEQAEATVDQMLASIRDRAKALDAMKAEMGKKAFEEFMERQEAKIAKAEIGLPNYGGKYVVNLDDLGMWVGLAMDAAKWKQPTWFTDERLSRQASKLVGEELISLLSDD